MRTCKTTWRWRSLAQMMAWMTVALLAACGGDDGSYPVAAPTITAQPADTQVAAGSAVRFSITADGNDVAYQWQRSSDGGTTWAAIAGATSASYTLATPTVADSGSRFRVLVSRGALQTISSAVTLTVSAVAVAPAITVQPQPVQLTAGGNASFAVTATGTTLAYRWQTSTDGSTWADASAGATATLTLSAVPLTSNQLQIRVIVSNSLASLTSNSVRLTVLEPPVAAAFTQHPAAATVVAPNTATFTVAASGTPAPTLQWQRSTDGGTTYVNIAGATAASYTTAATSLADSGSRYRVVATNATASVNSDAAVLNVTAALVAPALTSEPADASVATGAPVSFSAAASGNPQPALQWQVSTDGGATFANINGATAASYTVAAAAASDNGRRYRVVATNSQGSVNSRAALLTVTAAASTSPSFTLQPADAAVVAPGSATFTVVTSGSPAPTLQWQRSRDGGASYADIGGATAASYTTAATTLADNATQYRLVATNASGSVASNAAVLSVAAAAVAPRITLQPLSVNAQANQPVSLTAAATGTPTPAFQWQVSTDAGLTYANINGATLPTLTFTPTLANDLQLYRVVVSNMAGSVTSLSPVLSVFVQTGPSSGRSWSAGQKLEGSDSPVSAQASAIDEQGTVAVIFSQSDGTRTALFAARGVRGTSGTLWSTPVVIDTTNTPVDDSTTIALATSPGGNLLASWNVRGRCTASTYSTAGNCNYLHTARYLAATGAWQAPLLLSDSPQPVLNARINDAGDVAGVFSSWARNGAAYTTLGGVAWLGAAQTAWQGRAFRLDTGADSFAPASVALDGRGGLHAFGTGLSAASSNVDVVVYSGQASTGFVSRQVLDSFAAAPTVNNAWASPAGAVAASWQGSRSSGSRATGAVAALDIGNTTWQVLNTGLPFLAGDGYAAQATLTDDGEFIAHSLQRCASLRRAPGGAAAEAPLPAALCSSVTLNNLAMATARNGDFIVVDSYRYGVPGRWLAYDARLRVQTDNFSADLTGYIGTVLGYPELPAGSLWLSSSGVAGYLSLNSYDVLPTRGQSGQTRGIVSLWGWTLR